MAQSRCDVAKEVYNLIDITHKPESGGPGLDGLVAKARRHQRRQHPCHESLAGSSLDSHELNAVIGLVTMATAALAGSRLQVVRHGGEVTVGGAMTGRPGLGLTPHPY